ncbi:glutamine--fructose-6-phosphate transaminase (isomerizing) [Bdellovibrio bacteriovorus]|uniref:glutamine--fructose-6-phosphate transaminase (isomerizing) n=1 Tax=Bdellovibrio bacteriovorus TaxID=959 RepID=UPI003A8056FA
MCGIVGYLGPQNPKDIIVSGLKKLEYRGYDSAGVAILDHGKTKRVRAQGKLKALEDKLATEKFDGHIGIGHTRWATHGKPSERNAHPHQVRGISLVHNGIIENYLDIREELKAQGADITSDTDSELVAHLIANEVEVTKDLFKAVQNVLEKIRGAFSILVMWEQEPDRLVAFKDGPPLVVGLGSKEIFVASDVQALIQYTKNFVYLEDREVASIKGADVQFFSANGFPIQKKVIELNWNPEMVEKQGYAHFMLKEIYEQPRAVAAAIEPHVNPETFSVALKNVGFGGQSVQKLEELDAKADWAKTQEVFKSIERVFIIACGTSNYAGNVGKYLIEQLAKVPVECDIASEFRYRNPVIPAKSLVITISQSGETADTLAAIRMAKEMGATTLSICNVKNSTIDREAHGHLYMNSGPEIGVASTKAFTSTMAVLNTLAIAIARTRGVMNEAEEKELVKSLLAVPSQMEGVLSYDKYFEEAASSLKLFRGFLYMGRGTSFPIAMEGALKLKELAYMHAEGYAAGEMKHGPLALIDERMAIVMVAPTDHLYEKTISNLEEARARGGKVISIGTGDNEKLREISEHYLAIPKAHWTVNAILSVIPLQLMSYHLASNLGYDVDQPRNLAKSVTVE